MSTTIFDSYAPIYAATGEEWVGLRLLNITRQWLAAAGLAPYSAADLACGTGAAAVALALGGVETYGVDRSSPMLALAQERARAADVAVTWLQQDLRALALPRQVELVTAFYDSFNYLLSAGDLHMAIAHAAEALLPGGVLAFDLLTPAEYESWSEGRDVVTVDRAELFVLSRRSFDPQTRIATGRMVWMTREGERWRRGEELHSQRAHAAAEVREALSGAGLALRARLALTGEPAGDDTLRILYIATRGQEKAPF